MTLDDILRQIFGSGGGSAAIGGDPVQASMAGEPPMYDPVSRRYASEAPSMAAPAPRLAAGGPIAEARPPAPSPAGAAPAASPAAPAANALDGLWPRAPKAGFFDTLGDVGLALQGKPVPDRAAMAAKAEQDRMRANTTFQWMLKEGLSPEEARAALVSPEAQKVLFARKFAKPEPPKVMEVNGRLVRVGPDGSAQEVYASPDGGNTSLQMTTIYDDKGREQKVLFNPKTGQTQPVGGAKVDIRSRQFTVNDLTKLREEGTKFANVSRFAETFKPEYAGYSVGGDLAMGAARIGFPVAATPEAASWWQDYDRFKNLVRNEMFGSALTATEKAAFEKADINPNMDPKLIGLNLKRQQQIATEGVRRQASAMVTAGYDPAVIAQAYGLDPRTLAADAPQGGGGGGATHDDALQQAREAIQNGADPAAVRQRLQENGIDPGAL